MQKQSDVFLGIVSEERAEINEIKQPVFNF